MIALFIGLFSPLFICQSLSSTVIYILCIFFYYYYLSILIYSPDSEHLYLGVFSFLSILLSLYNSTDYSVSLRCDYLIYYFLCLFFLGFFLSFFSLSINNSSLSLFFFSFPRHPLHLQGVSGTSPKGHCFAIIIFLFLGLLLVFYSSI